MLYQESLEPTDQGNVITDSIQVKRLKYEIRIPRQTFENLCKVGAQACDILDRADKLTDGIEDESVDDAYWKLNEQISQLIFDTNVGADHLEIRKANELIQDLNERVNSIRPSSPDPDEEQGESQQ